MNSSRVAACALRKEQAVRAHRPGRPVRFAAHRLLRSRVRKPRKDLWITLYLLLICILLLSYSFIFFRFYFFINVYTVVFPFNTVIYAFLFLCQCILIESLCIFIVPAGTLRLPWLRLFRAFSSVVRPMPGHNPQRRGTVRTLPKFLCCSMYRLFCVVLCTVCV
jgi:hypothetical protein